MRASVCVSLVLLVLCAVAHADDDVAGARRHYEAGTRAFNLGEFDNAAKEYREAYKLKPDPAFLYNIAQAYRMAKNGEQALFFYQSFLRNSPNVRNRKEIEGRIRVLEQQLAQVQAPPNDLVKPSLPVETKVAPRPFPPAGPAAATPAAPLPAAVPPPSMTSDTRSDLTAAPPAPPLYRRWWLWTAAGVVVVGVVLGVGLGVGLKSDVPSSQLGTYRLF